MEQRLPVRHGRIAGQQAGQEPCFELGRSLAKRNSHISEGLQIVIDQRLTTDAENPAIGLQPVRFGRLSTSPIVELATFTNFEKFGHFTEDCNSLCFEVAGCRGFADLTHPTLIRTVGLAQNKLSRSGENLRKITRRVKPPGNQGGCVHSGGTGALRFQAAPSHVNNAQAGEFPRLIARGGDTEPHQLHSQIQEPTELAGIYNNLGMVYNQLEEWETAEDMLLKAITAYRRFADIFNWANSLDNMADLYEARGETAEFKRTLQEAIAGLQALKETPHAVELLNYMSQRLISAAASPAN